jgi:hypothetical protein
MASRNRKDAKREAEAGCDRLFVYIEVRETASNPSTVETP